MCFSLVAAAECFTPDVVGFAVILVHHRGPANKQSLHENCIKALPTPSAQLFSFGTRTLHQYIEEGIRARAKFGLYVCVLKYCKRNEKRKENVCDCVVN